MQSNITPAAAESGFRFVKRDVGKGHRTNDAADCTVRALTLAAGIQYLAAWQLLYEAQGRLRNHCFQIFAFMDAEPQTFGVLRKLSFPAVKGQRRMTPREFAGRHPAGSFILQVSNHATVIEDGVLYDRFDCSDRCVYAAWEINPKAFRRVERLEATR